VDKAIDFELADQEGKSWRLSDNLARGPVVLVFYRGDW
jgi:peroxiredoxin